MQSVILFFHIAGVGLIFCGIVAVPIVESMFHAALDAKTAHTLHKVIMRLGILTPIASGVLLISGIMNILAEQLIVFKEVWLILKLMVFIIMVTVGFFQGKSYRRRGRLVEAIALDNAPGKTPAEIELLTRNYYRGNTNG
jgi:uncharacterized membrane protein SirB2